VTTLEELRINIKESQRWQQIALVPEDKFEARLRILREAGKRATTNSFLDIAFSSDTPEWLTPKEILRAVIRVLGEIDLDPCSDPGKNVTASAHFTEKDDGLSRPWRGRVFMNPPYGDAVAAWVQRLADEYASGNVTEAIALVAARTDTAWFNLLEDPVVCFVRGRLKFGGAVSGPAPFPSALFYVGKKHRAGFASRFAKIGAIYTRITVVPEKD